MERKLTDLITEGLYWIQSDVCSSTGGTGLVGNNHLEERPKDRKLFVVSGRGD